MIAALVITSGLQAVLPPLYQNKKEIEAILNSPELSKAIPEGESLEEIRKTDKGYLVITRRYLVVVLVRYHRMKQMVGPAKFTLEFSRPVPICGCDKSPNYEMPH